MQQTTKMITDSERFQFYEHCCFCQFCTQNIVIKLPVDNKNRNLGWSVCYVREIQRARTYKPPLFSELQLQIHVDLCSTVPYQTLHPPDPHPSPHQPTFTTLSHSNLSFTCPISFKLPHKQNMRPARSTIHSWDGIFMEAIMKSNKICLCLKLYFNF